MTDTTPPSFIDDWLRACVLEIVRSGEFEAYRARLLSLASLHERDWIAAGTAPESVRPVLMLMARAVWGHCPNPHLQYAPGRLPELQRNAPCHCGSLRKYKHCCLEAERAVPVGRINYLPWLAEALPRKRWP